MTAGFRRDPPQALWAHGRIELPAIEIRALIGRACSAVRAGHRIVLHVISFRGEILPTLERDNFGHDTTSSLISGGARHSLHRTRERTLGRPTQKRCATLHDRSGSA
jgi:hypothetical protein